jgi:hypothetical protein
MRFICAGSIRGNDSDDLRRCGSFGKSAATPPRMGAQLGRPSLVGGGLHVSLRASSLLTDPRRRVGLPLVRLLRGSSCILSGYPVLAEDDIPLPPVPLLVVLTFVLPRLRRWRPRQTKLAARPLALPCSCATCASRLRARAPAPASTAAASAPPPRLSTQSRSAASRCSEGRHVVTVIPVVTSQAVNGRTAPPWRAIVLKAYTLHLVLGMIFVRQCKEAVLFPLPMLSLSAPNLSDQV